MIRSKMEGWISLIFKKQMIQRLRADENYYVM